MNSAGGGHTLHEHVLVSNMWNCGIFKLQRIEACLAGYSPSLVAHICCDWLGIREVRMGGEID